MPVLAPLLGLVAAASPHQGFVDRPAEPPPAVPAPPAAPPRDVLVVSGGISLGSYEAGSNWATVRLLKRATEGAPARADAGLQAASGASAGNINVLLASITYCQAPGADAAERVDANLFWDAWVPVGLDTLFNGSHAKDDGLFTRHAFAEAKAAIRDAVEPSIVGPPRYVPGCRVDVGVTLTRRRAAVTRDPNLNLTLLDQGAFAAFEVSPDAAGRGIELRAIDGAPLGPFPMPRDGRYLRLRRDGLGRVAFDDVVSVVEASSAFPVAFGPRLVHHCVEPGKRPGVADPRCPPGLVRTTEAFIDGGVFDNLPLALGSDLLARRTYRREWIPPGERARFLTIDPDYRRPFGVEPPPVHRLGRSLEFYLDVTGELVSVARQREIRSFAQVESVLRRAGTIGKNDFVVGSRYGPIHGEHAGNFAAFFARSFREYDFYAGVYDGVYDWVANECLERSPCPDGGSTCLPFATCFVRRAKAAHDALLCPGGRCGGRAADASYVFRTLLEREARTILPADVLEAVAKVELEPGVTAEAFLRAPSDVSPLVMKLHEANAKLDRWLRPQAHGLDAAPPPTSSGERFEKLRALLVAEGADRLLVDAERDVVASYDDWLNDRIVAGAWRLVDIEKDEYLEGMEVPRELGEAVLQAERSFRHVGYDGDPSSIPEDATRALHLLPHSLMFDVRNGGWELGWRPTIGLHRYWAIGVPFGFGYMWRGEGYERWLAGGGASLVFRPPGNVGWFLSSVELGPKLVGQLPFTERSRAFPDDPVVGLEGTATLGGKLRVGALWRPRLAADVLPHDETFFVGTIGLGDLNGIAYWGLRLLHTESPAYEVE